MLPLARNILNFFRSQDANIQQKTTLTSGRTLTPMKRLNNHTALATGVLVIGGGGAGLRAAIEIARQGVEVTLVAKEVLGAAHTGMAEGGLNVALPTVNPLNTAAVHFKDTLSGGAGLNNQKLVDIFTREIADRVRDLESYGTIFDRSADGKMAQRFSGKQTHPHTIFVGDYTGQAMMAGLVAEVRKLGVGYFDEHFVTTLFARDGQACGALAFDINRGAFRLFTAKAILLATGGGGRMYRVTTNARSNTADGYAMALRLGCPLVDMEMVQFHPTGMVFPPSARGRLVTESVRGEGGQLKNSEGDRFMARYNPQRMELAGRDEVARAIYAEVQAGRGSPNGGVYLDVSHLPAALLEKRLPKMVSQFLGVGVDIRQEPMEVHPTMHHLMGGVRIDEWGQTAVAGLFAAGETTGGVHGGNRLGGNAIGECQVFGRRAALSAVDFARKATAPLAPLDSDLEREYQRISRFLPGGAKPTPAAEILEQLRGTMWQKVGIVRSEETLQQASAELQQLANELEHVAAHSDHLPHNHTLMACLELDNMVTVAQVIVAGALLRQESRGAHFRRDYPQPDEAWERFNIEVTQENGEIKCRQTPVVTLEGPVATAGGQ